MEEWSPQPVQPAFGPAITPKEPDLAERKPPRKRPARPDAEALKDMEEITESTEGDDPRALDCFAAAMTPDAEDPAAYLACLESSLSAWRELGGAIDRSCTALVNMDLDGIHMQIANQERLCAVIRSLDEREKTLAPRFAADAETTGRVRELRAAIADCRIRAGRSNRVQEGLLRHSSQMVRRLSNALVRFFATYPAPEPTRASR